MELNEVINDAYKIHDQLEDTIEHIQLKKIEEQMLSDTTLSSIFLRYRQLQEQYTNLKTEDLLQKMHQLKIKIDQNPIVIEYQKKFKLFEQKVNEIKNIIFADLINKDDILVALKYQK